MNRRDRSRGSRHKGRSRSRDSKSGKVDLRSKISTMRRKRESRDRSVSPLHSIVHKVIDKGAKRDQRQERRRGRLKKEKKVKLEHQKRNKSTRMTDFKTFHCKVKIKKKTTESI